MAGTGRDGACARSAMLTGTGPPHCEPPAGGGRSESSGGPQPCVKGEGGGQRAAARSALLCVCAAPWLHLIQWQNPSGKNLDLLCVICF